MGLQKSINRKAAEALLEGHPRAEEALKPGNIDLMALAADEELKEIIVDTHEREEVVERIVQSYLRKIEAL